MKQGNTWILVGLVVVVVLVVMLKPDFLSSFSFNIPSPANSNTNNYYNQTQSGSSNSRSPTSLYAVVEPNPVAMKGRVLGTVTSDGYKSPIAIHAKHRGQGVEQAFGGLLDDNGRFLLTQTISLPGYWNFWVTSGTVSSNTVSLTVQGIATSVDRDHVSKSLSPTCIVSVFSNYAGNVAVFANDPAHGVSIPLTNTVVNSGGYGSVQVDFSTFAQGSYEIDALINGETASTYGGTCWVTVGR